VLRIPSVARAGTPELEFAPLVTPYKKTHSSVGWNKLRAVPAFSHHPRAGTARSLFQPTFYPLFQGRQILQQIAEVLVRQAVVEAVGHDGRCRFAHFFDRVA